MRPTCVYTRPLAFTRKKKKHEMEDKIFWDLIESAWEKSGKNKDRKKAIETNDEETLEELSQFIEIELIGFYQTELEKLDKNDFIAYIHHFENKLYQIDREEIHEYTDGSDDGFLYCRCFILAMGKEYFNMIDGNPSKAKFDLEAEEFGFEAYMYYEKNFSEEFERNSIHCIESCSNPKGWKN